MYIDRHAAAALKQDLASFIAGAAPALHAQTGAEVRELVTASQLGLGGGSIPKWRMAGVVGALLSKYAN